MLQFHFFFIQHLFSALRMALRAAKKMKMEKLMIQAGLPMVEKNFDNLTKWKGKGWSHGGKGKGRPVAQKEDWIAVQEMMNSIEIDWVWNPQGATFKSVLASAQSMGIAP